MKLFLISALISSITALSVYGYDYIKLKSVSDGKFLYQYQFPEKPGVLEWNSEKAVYTPGKGEPLKVSL